MAGLSMVSAEERPYLYGECGENSTATRMIREGRYKLIYYPVGNRVQLFDIEDDPCELADLAAVESHSEARTRLTGHLISNLYGGDEAWVANGQLVGMPDQAYHPSPNRNLSGQRGIHYPTPPQLDADKAVGMP